MTHQHPLRPARANTILYCAEWAATVAFYRDRLALPVTFANDWFVEFYLADGARLSVADASRATIAPVAGQGITLAWQVANLAAARAALLAAGVATTPPQRRWGAWVCYCRDPEGHRIELWEDDSG